MVGRGIARVAGVVSLGGAGSVSVKVGDALGVRSRIGVKEGGGGKVNEVVGMTMFGVAVTMRGVREGVIPKGSGAEETRPISPQAARLNVSRMNKPGYFFIDASRTALYSALPT
jgi:hypothetical protein